MKRTILITLAITLTFIGCDNNNNNGNNDPVCECTVKVHPFGSPCACPVAGTSACDCIEETHREFTIILEGFEDHPITVIDTRTGSNDTDLETLGVIARLTAGLQAQTGGEFNTVVDRNLTIEVEETEEYARFKTMSGNKMSIRLDYILSDDTNFIDRIAGAFEAMYLSSE